MSSLRQIALFLAAGVMTLAALVGYLNSFGIFFGKLSEVILISPGSILYKLGVGAPFVQAGGGPAWLTFVGVTVLYLLPAIVLVMVALRLLRAQVPSK